MGTADMLRSTAVLAPRGVRSFAAKAPAALPAAPIRLHGLDGRYATSLWRVASSKNEVAAVEKDLGNIMGKFEEIQRAAKGEIHAEVTSLMRSLLHSKRPSRSLLTASLPKGRSCPSKSMSSQKSLVGLW